MRSWSRPALSFLVLAVAAFAVLLATSVSHTSNAQAQQRVESTTPAKATAARLSFAAPDRQSQSKSPGRTENRDRKPRESLPNDPCERNVAIAAKRGLTLPDGWEFHCVGPGLDWDGNTHWGVTCPYSECPEGAGPYVSVSNPNYYVISHELCHANFGNDELMADQCAAKHGASLATSPYQG